jgi:hypothetical protein
MSLIITITIISGYISEFVKKNIIKENQHL